jgi:signal transduction histidine kinase
MYLFESMRLTLCVLCAVVLLLFVPVISSAQISTGLYRDLPDSLKPADRLHLKIPEVNKILKHWFKNADWKASYYDEADSLCFRYAGSYRRLKTVREQCDFLHTVCGYLYFSSGRATEVDESLVEEDEILPPAQATLGLRYCEIFIRRFPEKSIFNKHFLPNVFLYKAHFLMAQRKHKEAYYVLMQSREIAARKGIASSISIAFSSLGYLSETLGLPVMAIRNYDEALKAIRNEPQTAWIVGQQIYCLYGKQRTFFFDYVKTNNPALTDSIQRLHEGIGSFPRQYNGAMEAESHMALAGVRYYQGRYAQSVAHVDSAMAIYPNLELRGLMQDAIAYRALGNIHLGHAKAGRALLRELNFSKVRSPVIGRMLEDLYGLSVSDGDYKAASDYQRYLLTYIKRKTKLELRGRSIELEQIYRVREQENQINKLHALQYRNMGIALLVVLVLISVSVTIYYRYRIGKANSRKLIAQVERMTELQSMQIEEAREFERKRLAQDLHDDFSASIAASISYLQMKANQAASEDAKLRALTVLNMLRDSYDRVRQRSYMMYWEDQTEGFLKRIEAMVHILFFGTNMEISLVSDLGGFELNADSKATILLILKESITNIIRHANATQVEITFFADVDTLVLEISDNGRGVGKRQYRKSLGLLSLKKRMETLGGFLSIGSKQPSGTVIGCTFPLVACGVPG